MLWILYNRFLVGASDGNKPVRKGEGMERLTDKLYEEKCRAVAEYAEMKQLM